MRYAGSLSALLRTRSASLAPTLLGALALFIGCSKPASSDPKTTTGPSESLPSPTATAETVAAKTQTTCDAPIPVFEDGRVARTVCRGNLAKEGLAVVDLSDTWAPPVLGEDASLGAAGRQPYRETFVALENERLGDGPSFDRARQDRFLELYGIFPSLSVMKARIGDEARHTCHDVVPNGPLEKLSITLDPWRDIERQRDEALKMKKLEQGFAAAMQKQGLASQDDLRGDARFAMAFSEYDRLGVRVLAIRTLQAHLRCEGLLSPRVAQGVLDTGTTQALYAYQRKHMIVSWSLDEETRKTLLTDSRELELRDLLRVLRERVVDATGLIEDGSARGEPGTVAGRTLDTEAFRHVVGGKPAENGAPDLVSAATDAAARALGWTSPAAARAWLTAAQPSKVALKLPPAPAYHAAHMDLRVEIDRGDVWYEFPYTARGEPRGFPVEHRPTLTLYAKTAEGEIALVRWPTTIGGWKTEKTGPRQVSLAYKESPAGPRFWKEIVATPVWIPPETTPKRDFVRLRPDGEYTLNTDVMGPGYASAYGLVLFAHKRLATVKNDKDPWRDEGIRTHGSVSYDSIHRGTSHGCHRLHNHMALRLGDFMLAHRATKHEGAIELGYGRSINWQGKSMTLSFPNGGQQWELDPPVPVEVLRGRVMGKQPTATTHPHALPDSMLEKFVQERFED